MTRWPPPAASTTAAHRRAFSSAVRLGAAEVKGAVSGERRGHGGEHATEETRHEIPPTGLANGARRDSAAPNRPQRRGPSEFYRCLNHEHLFQPAGTS